MANNTRNLEYNSRREKRDRQYRKAGGTIFDGRLLSCYAASAVIVGLCLYEFFTGKDDIIGGGISYIFLAVVAIVLSVYITVRNRAAKKAAERKKHK